MENLQSDAEGNIELTFSRLTVAFCREELRTALDRRPSERRPAAVDTPLGPIAVTFMAEAAYAERLLGSLESYINRAPRFEQECNPRDVRDVNHLWDQHHARRTHHEGVGFGVVWGVNMNATIGTLLAEVVGETTIRIW